MSGTVASGWHRIQCDLGSPASWLLQGQRERLVVSVNTRLFVGASLLANHAISRAQQPRQGGSAGKRSTLTNLQFTPDGDHPGAVIALLYGADCLFQRSLGDVLVLLGNRIDPDRQEIQQLRVTKGGQAQMLWPEQVPFSQCIEDAFQ